MGVACHIHVSKPRTGSSWAAQRREPNQQQIIVNWPFSLFMCRDSPSPVLLSIFKCYFRFRKGVTWAQWLCGRLERQSPGSQASYSLQPWADCLGSYMGCPVPNHRATVESKACKELIRHTIRNQSRCGFLKTFRKFNLHSVKFALFKCAFLWALTNSCSHINRRHNRNTKQSRKIFCAPFVGTSGNHWSMFRRHFAFFRK